MRKATSRVILLLFPLLLISSLEINGWQNNQNKRQGERPAGNKGRNPNRRAGAGQPENRPPPPAEAESRVGQIETQLQSTKGTVEDLRSQIDQLKQKPDQGVTQGRISRWVSNWDIVIATLIFALLVGGVCGVFFAPRLQYWFQSPLREQLLDVSNKTTTLQTQTESTNGRLGQLEAYLPAIYNSLLSMAQTKTGQPANKTGRATEDAPTTLSTTNQSSSQLAGDGTQGGALARIGVVPPSEYVEAVRSSAMLCKTTTTNHDFRHPDKLVESDDGRFLIISVKDGSSLHTLALPAADRLSGSDEFNYYYKGVFDCDRPIGGDIYVITPARMAEDVQQGEWTLHSRGKLEIRR